MSANTCTHAYKMLLLRRVLANAGIHAYTSARVFSDILYARNTLRIHACTSARVFGDIPGGAKKDKDTGKKGCSCHEECWLTHEYTHRLAQES